MSDAGLKSILFLSASGKWRAAETSTLVRLKALGEIKAETPVRGTMIEPGVPAAFHPLARDHFSDEDRTRVAPESGPEPEAETPRSPGPSANAAFAPHDDGEDDEDGNYDEDHDAEAHYGEEYEDEDYDDQYEEADDEDEDDGDVDEDEDDQDGDDGGDDDAPASSQPEHAAILAYRADLKAPAAAATAAAAAATAAARSGAPSAGHEPPSGPKPADKDASLLKVLFGAGAVSVVILLALSVLNNLGQPPGGQTGARGPSSSQGVEVRAFLRANTVVHARPDAQSNPLTTASRGAEVIRLGAVRSDGWVRIRLPNGPEGYVNIQSLTTSAPPRLAEGSQPSQRQITDGTQVRSSPGGSTILAALRQGQSVQVVGQLNDRREWVEVTLSDGRVGYIPVQSLQRSPAAAPPVAARPAPEPQPEPATRTVFALTAMGLHTQASTTASTSGRVERGAQLTQLGEPNAFGWVQVRDTQRRTGWVWIRQLAADRPPALDVAGGQLIVTAPSARVYRQAGRSPFTELPAGQQVAAQGRLRDQSGWVEVMLVNGEIGYMRLADFGPHIGQPDRSPPSAGFVADSPPESPQESKRPGAETGAAQAPVTGPVTAPVWVRRPTAQEMSDAQPMALRRGRAWRRTEQVTFRCRFNAANRLEQCQTVSPSTSDGRFHDWGRAIMAQYEARPLDEAGHPVAGRSITMRTFDFEPPPR